MAGQDGHAHTYPDHARIQRPLQIYMIFDEGRSHQTISCLRGPTSGGSSPFNERAVESIGSQPLSYCPTRGPEEYANSKAKSWQSSMQRYGFDNGIWILASENTHFLKAFKCSLRACGVPMICGFVSKAGEISIAPSGRSRLWAQHCTVPPAPLTWTKPLL